MDSSKQENYKLSALEMATDIVASYVGHNNMSPQDVPAFFKTVYLTVLKANNQNSDTEVTSNRPAVPVRKSVTPEYLICLEDGRRLKMLKRHLKTAYGLTPEEYKKKWGLPANYPMVAPNYSQQRSKFAKKIGLGLK